MQVSRSHAEEVVLTIAARHNGRNFGRVWGAAWPKDRETKEISSMRTVKSVALLLCALALSTAPAFGQNPHFTSGPTATVSGFNNSVLTACSTIAGLGSTPTDITLSCSNVTFQCVNRAGTTNNAHQTLTATQEFTPHNGTIKNACVSVSATCPPGQAGPFNVQFQGCTYTVSQNGQVVLTSNVP
jgi:hypothetical protein